jgi:glycosyltransferase involved in cell wall biosynthesis
MLPGRRKREVELENPSQLRILQVISSSATSGAEKHVLHLSRRLQEKGHFVKVVCPHKGWLPTVLEDSEIACKISGMKGSGWYRTMLFLMHQARKHKVDVIHTHLTRAAYIGHAASILSRTPTVTSVHIANNDQIYKRLARGTNRLVAVSNFVRGMLHGKGVPDRYVDTVYNGTDFVDIARSDPAGVMDEFKIPSSRRLIGLVGRVCKEKGHLEMVQAMKEIRKDHPEAHLMFVGRVEEPFAAEFDDAIRSSGIGDRVTLTGIRHDVPRLLDSFTMSTMPSHIETFGIAALEAMARSKAVVATRVGGLPEVVRHGQTGILVDVRPDELAEAVSYLMSNDDVREEMGANGRRLVEQKFTIGEMVRQFENVYNRAAGRAE